MIQYETHLGKITISQDYFSNLIGEAVSSCYGVVNMEPTGFQKIRAKLFRRQYSDAGIRVSGSGRSLVVNLHVGMMYGMNVNAISKSIVNKVTYVVEEATGIKVSRVVVHVDRICEE